MGYGIDVYEPAHEIARDGIPVIDVRNPGDLGEQVFNNTEEAADRIRREQAELAAAARVQAETTDNTQ